MADLETNLRRLAEISAFWANGRREVQKLTRRVFQWVKPRAVKRLKEKLTNDLLHVRTGRLRGAADAEVVETGSVVSLQLGILEQSEALVYGPIQEFGGTVKPVNAQHLYIPTEFAKTPAGVPRFTPRGAESEYATFVRRSRLGNLLEFGRPLGGGDVVPLFVLKDEVIIPATHFVGSTAEEMRPLVIERLEVEMAALMAARPPDGGIAA